MNGAVFIPALIALGALLLAWLERRERRRAEAELKRWQAFAAARAHGTNGTVPDWRWPPTPHPQEDEIS